MVEPVEGAVHVVAMSCDATALALRDDFDKRNGAVKRSRRLPFDVPRELLVEALGSSTHTGELVDPVFFSMWYQRVTVVSAW